MYESDDLSTALSLKTAFEQLPPEVFRLAVEQAAVAISITDARARILYANPSFARVTGYTQDELIGQNQSILSYKVTPKLVYDDLWRTLQNKASWQGLLVNRRKDGSRYLADLTITPVLDEQGEIKQYLGLQRDITELHQLERQVMNQQTLIQSALDATDAAMVMVTSDWKPVLLNRGYRELESLLQTSPLEVVIAALERQWPDVFKPGQALQEGFNTLEVALPGRQDPPLWFSCSGALVEEKDTSADAFYNQASNRYLLVTLQNISHLKRQQKQLQLTSLQALLSEQERLQSVREALSGAIYQLERPLNLVKAAARLVGRRADSNPRALLEILGEVDIAGNEAINHLQRHLPEAVQEELQSINLNELLQTTLSLMTQRLLAGGIIVDWQPEAQLSSIRGRPTSLVTLFKQLLDNALDSLEASRSSQREIAVRTRSTLDAVEVQIEDSGPGIPAADQLRVFEPFYTTRSHTHKHLGMGLTLAQEIVNSHQGLLEIDPEFSKGCRIKVLLPYV